ncbi:rapamycin-insensitive companion of Tor isoform X2 [Rhodnius prolixus]|uniref:rapamycin-insensitive companion of Tor isoform X2 n=1 Tax=Rhodnius prolixus TaxID=13249 RepID=UPI003D18BF46
MSSFWALGLSSQNRRTCNDPAEVTSEILSNITMKTGLTESKRLGYLNAFVKLLLKPDINYEDLGYTAQEILHCLRPQCFLESTKLKNATFRAVRHFIKTEEHVDIFNKLKYDFLIAREITAGGLQLCRRVLVVCPNKLTHAPVRAIVSFTHPSHSDNLQSAALAFLAEIAMLNADLFITCGGVGAIIRNLPCLRSAKMTEALLGPLLYLANRPETRCKAGINLHCLTGSVYIDRGLNTKSSSTAESNVRWCTTAMVCLLKSWPGLFHLCQGNRRAISSIVDSLYVTYLQKPILEVMYKLFDLTQPEWTDEISVALEAVDPARWNDSFRIAEGFVAAEAMALFPHLAKSWVNLVEVHRAFLLYLLLEANLLEAIVHVIASDDTFLSVHATILLGELLHMVHTVLPPELVSLTPGLPNLLSYAVRGRPVNIVPNASLELESANKFWVDLFGPDFSFHQIQLTNSDVEPRKEAQERALRAVYAMSHLHRRQQSSPSVHLRHLINSLRLQSSEANTARIKNKEKASKLFSMSSCDEAIKESGVLTVKDPYDWNWDVIRAVLKRHGETLRKSTDSNKKLFLRRLISFLLPVTGQYGRTELWSDRKSNNRLTLAGLDLLSTLLAAPEDSDSEKLVMELLAGIRTQLVDLTTAKSAHDCHLSPTNISNSLCQDYFLFIGHLTASPQGRRVLEKANIYKHLMELASTTNQDCYIKLIVSSMDYSNDEMARKILKKIFESKSVACRLYATKMIHAILRIGVGENKQLTSFLIGLIVEQLSDEDRNVAAVALNALQEASHSKEYVEAIVEQRPCLMRHGDNGLMVVVRCLSSESGFKALQQANFVTAQLSKWGTHYNYRYVNIVESLLASESYQTKNVFLPPHLYQQLASHQQGLNMVLADEYVEKLCRVLERSDPRTDREILETKAALYALSGIAGVMETSVLLNMMRIATQSLVYSVRAVAFIALSNVATSSHGANKLKAFNWYSVRHNRHVRWPLVLSQNSSTFIPFDQDSSIHESEKSGYLFDLPEESGIGSAEGEEIYWGVPGGRTQKIRERRSATLPHSTGAPAYNHNRSFSESKAEQSDSSDYASERVQTLSPIPSTGSLATFQSHRHRGSSIVSNFSRTSLRGSQQSILRSFEQPSPYPLGLITYGDLHQLSPVNRPKPAFHEIDWNAPKSLPEPDFSTVDTETLDITSLPSNSNDILEVPLPIYMGICLPYDVGCLFPKEEKNLLSNHVTFISDNLKAQGSLEDLKNPSFHREVCFLGHRASHNTMVNTSETEVPYLVEAEIELEKETLDNDSADSSLTDVQSLVEKPMPVVFKSRAVIRNELARMVEQLSNPILHKNCKQSLLQMKQFHGDLFEDTCVLSDVCHILSTCQVRIASRDFVHELFVSPMDEVWSDAAELLAVANLRRSNRQQTSISNNCG